VRSKLCVITLKSVFCSPPSNVANLPNHFRSRERGTGVACTVVPPRRAISIFRQNCQRVPPPSVHLQTLQLNKRAHHITRRKSVMPLHSRLRFYAAAPSAGQGFADSETCSFD